MKLNNDIVGLIPAAGFATRISSYLSGSKEVYPILMRNGEKRVISSFLIESFQEAEAKKAYLVLRKGKWDIPEYFSNGRFTGTPLAYIISESTKGVPYTLDKAYPFVKDNIILLGFPDIIFKPLDAFKQLLNQQQKTGADIVLGLFKTDKPEKADMVVFSNDMRLKDIIIKPKNSQEIYAWVMAVWTPAFTHFMHEKLHNNSAHLDHTNEELHIGDIIRAAILSEMKTSYIKFDSGSFLDIGTPEELKKTKNQNWIALFNRN